MKTQKGVRQTSQRRNPLTERLHLRWPRWGLHPRPKVILPPLEHAVESVLRPVEPPAQFRARLRNDLAFALQRRVGGLVIEYPRPIRESVILGVAAGALAMLIATLVLVFRSRLAGVGR